jgi:hypothetical protein
MFSSTRWWCPRSGRAPRRSASMSLLRPPAFFVFGADWIA